MHIRINCAVSRERRAAPFDGDNGQNDPEEAAIKRINLSRAHDSAQPPLSRHPLHPSSPRPS
jgi:hypothetical protein